jgi:RNA-splicing ligase RtcB
VGRKKSNGNICVVTHHGSRNFGSLLFSKGVKIAEKFCSEISPNLNKKIAWIPFDTQEGKNYWDALQIVREWTKLNHTLIHEAIQHKINSLFHNLFWNEHNFVFKRDNLFLHGKGATPLSSDFVPDSQDGLRLIPMNMRDGILIVRGEETQTNLGFTSHGAGREMSRTEHSKKVLVNKNGNELFDEETKGLDVRFFSGNIDITELPSAYKNATKVKEQIKKFNLGEIIDEIESYGCIMDGHSSKW